MSSEGLSGSSSFGRTRRPASVVASTCRQQGAQHTVEAAGTGTLPLPLPLSASLRCGLICPAHGTHCYERLGCRLAPGFLPRGQLFLCQPPLPPPLPGLLLLIQSVPRLLLLLLLSCRLLLWLRRRSVVPYCRLDLSLAQVSMLRGGGGGPACTARFMPHRAC